MGFSGPTCLPHVLISEQSPDQGADRWVFPGIREQRPTCLPAVWAAWEGRQQTSGSFPVFVSKRPTCLPAVWAAWETWEVRGREAREAREHKKRHTLQGIHSTVYFNTQLYTFIHMLVAISATSACGYTKHK